MDLRSKTANPTISTSAYTANRYVGAPTLLGGLLGPDGVARIRNVLVNEIGTQKAPLTLLLVNGNPGALVDGGTPSLSSLDGEIVAKFDVATADYETVGGVSIARYTTDQIVNGNKNLPPTSTGDLWLLIVGTGTPTFGAANALSVTLGAELGDF